MNENGKKRREWVKNAAIIFLAILLVLTFFSNTIMNYSLPEVAAQYVESGSITAKIRGTGTIESGDPYNVEVQESRKVQSVAVKAGDKVEKGDVILYLEDTESDELKAARDALEQAQDAYDLALLSSEVNQSIINGANSNTSTASYRQQITDAQNAVAAEQKKVDEWQAKYDDISNKLAVLPSNTADVTKEQKAYNDAKTAKDNADFALTEAQNRLKTISNQLEYEMTHNSVISDLTAQKSAAEKDVSNAQTAVNTAQTAADDANAVRDNANTALDNANAALTEAQNRLETILKQLEDAADDNSVIEDLTAQKNAAEKDVLDARVGVENAQKVANDAQTAADKAQTDLNNANATLTEAQNKLTNISNQLEEVTGGDSVIGQLTSQKSAAEQDELNAKTAADNAALTLQKAQTALDNKKAQGDTSSTSSSWQNQQNIIKVNLDAATKVLQEKQEALTELTSNINKTLNLQGLYDTVAKAQEEVDKQLEKTQNTTVTAGISGTITALNITAGQTTVPGTPVAVMQPEGKGYTMSFSVTNEQAKRLSVGDRADLVNSWRYDNVEVVLASIKTDKNEPGQKKLLTFDVTGDVVAGQTLNVSVGQKSAEYDLIVPNSAIREDNNGKFVLIVESKSSPLGNRYYASRVDVQVVASDDTKSAVTGALYGYEFVITTSTKPVEAGKLVRLAEN